PDPLTLKVTLISRTPYFLELTAFPTYMPVQKAIVEKNEVAWAWATKAETYIGNGPYKVTEFVPSSHITMEKNKNYWEANKIGPDKIIFHFIEDNATALSDFQSGKLAFIDYIPPDKIESLRNNPAFHMPAQMATYYISFNNQKAPFNNPLVRKAFSLAIDRSYIANVLAKGYIPAGAWIPPELSDADPSKKFRNVGGNYIDPSESAYASNLKEAKAALAKAGYPNGKGLPVIKYIYNDLALHQTVAKALQNMWGQLGAKIDIKQIEWATFLNARKNGEYMAARDGWLNDYNDPIGMLDLFVTGGGNNDPQYKNPAYDALITKIKATGDNVERMKLMHQAEDILMNDWVFAPVMYYADPYMMNPALGNSVWVSPLGYKYFMYAKMN
ncbi:MAG: peptide ABC transporter substrate-binding protein, partial [Oscillospiraceae bacterium]|nr:peptide ABC transporter substrate-binding protein [Oscillospiraceae bacterium]